ncbi:MAG: ribose-5-phosphate isomerase RpiA [Hyphomicrobiales bacterium]
MSPDEHKRAAARKALDLVGDGMRLGLGTGSTAAMFVEALGERVAGGLKVTGVPTSQATRRQAEGLGIPLVELDETPLDLTVDGADEINPGFNLIKGGGGALLREKIVAASSRRMIVVADASKQVETLGRFALPVEIIPFGAASTARRIAEAARQAGCDGELVLRRSGGEPLVTDNGNWILDCHFGAIPAPADLAVVLAIVPGVVEHGLFVALCQGAIIGGPDGPEMLGDVG